MERGNQRVLLTKRLIKESLIHLLSDHSIYDISIRQLCAHAGINRSTFYKHYGSQYDLLVEMEQDFLAHIHDTLDAAEVISSGSALEQVMAVATYAQENLALSRMLFNNHIDPAFSAKLFALPSVRALLEDALSLQYDGKSKEAVFSFVINGSYSLLLDWVNSDDRQPPEEIAALVFGLAQKVCYPGNT